MVTVFTPWVTHKRETYYLFCGGKRQLIYSFSLALSPRSTFFPFPFPFPFPLSPPLSPPPTTTTTTTTTSPPIFSSSSPLPPFLPCSNFPYLVRPIHFLSVLSPRPHAPPPPHTAAPCPRCPPQPRELFGRSGTAQRQTHTQKKQTQKNLYFYYSPTPDFRISRQRKKKKKQQQQQQRNQTHKYEQKKKHNKVNGWKKNETFPLFFATRYYKQSTMIQRQSGNVFR